VFIDSSERELLDAILDAPHLVAIVSQAVAGDEDPCSAANVAAWLGGALIVGVQQRSRHVSRLLAPRGTN
jgi:hypothetical protein